MKTLSFWLLFIFIVLSGIIRSISWHDHFLNIDELEWVYLIKRLNVNPLPFQGFNAHTSGPIAIYTLSVVNLLTGIPPLISLRLFQFFLCIVPTFFLIFSSVSIKGRLFAIFFFFLIIISPDNYQSFLINPNDFYAYNTEYQIMVFIAIIYYLQLGLSATNGKIFLIIGLCVMLFFLKSQAVIFSLYFLIVYFFQLIIFQREKLKTFLIYSGVISLAISLGLIYLNVFDDFKYEYIYQNFLYAKSNGKGFFDQFSNLRAAWFQSLEFFWGILFLLVITVFLLWWKSLRLDKELNNLLKSSSLLITSLGVLFLSTNNFGHYKVILFLPISIFSGELFHLIRIYTKPLINSIIALVGIFYVIIYKPVIKEVLEVIIKNQFEDYKSKIGFNPLYAPPAYWLNDISLNIKERNQIKGFLYSQLKANYPKNKVFIFGWFIGQGIFYSMAEDIYPVSRSANTYHLIKNLEENDMPHFLKQELALIQDFEKDQPHWIIDSERILTQLKNQKLSKYIKARYEIIFQSKNFLILKSKS